MNVSSLFFTRLFSVGRPRTDAISAASDVENTLHQKHTADKQQKQVVHGKIFNYRQAA
jgi:hypothetical protein